MTFVTMGLATYLFTDTTQHFKTAAFWQLQSEQTLLQLVVINLPEVALGNCKSTWCVRNWHWWSGW